MNWSDPVIDEIRRIREEYAASHGHDLQRILRDLQEKEKASGRKIVMRGPHHPEGISVRERRPSYHAEEDAE